MSISPTAIRALLLLSLLAGCASETPRPADEEGAATWEAHRSALASLESWGFSGRIAVKTEHGADSARLVWRQRADDLEMSLSGPVGIKSATLLREDRRLILLQDGERTVLAPGDDPVAREFGWSMPLDYLPWWLRGLPAPRPSPILLKFEYERLTELEQAGWTIEYAEYQWVDGYSLPRSIRFRRAGIEGKILLKNWVLTL